VAIAGRDDEDKVASPGADGRLTRRSTMFGLMTDRRRAQQKRLARLPPVWYSGRRSMEQAL